MKRSVRKLSQKKTRLEPEKKKKRGSSFEKSLEDAEAHLVKIVSAKNDPKMKKELGMALPDQYKKAVNNARYTIKKTERCDEE